MQQTLLLIDVQEKLFPAVQASERLLKQLNKCLRAHKLLELPLIITEQYPQGLGKTLDTLRALVPDELALEKTSFSCFGANLEHKLAPPEKTELFLIGIEAHICVYQTCVEALSKGYKVTILTDCISSRNDQDKKMALRNMGKAGAKLSTFECEYMNLIKDARHPSFKGLSTILKD